MKITTLCTTLFLVIAVATSAMSQNGFKESGSRSFGGRELQGVYLMMSPAEVEKVLTVRGYSINKRTKQDSWLSKVASRERSLGLPTASRAGISDRVVDREWWGSAKNVGLMITYKTIERGPVVESIQLTSNAALVSETDFLASAVAKFGKPTNPMLQLWCHIGEPTCNTRNPLRWSYVQLTNGPGYNEILFSMGEIGKEILQGSIQTEVNRRHPKKNKIEL